MSDETAGHPGPSLEVRCFVFMAVFWPVSLLLGVVDHWFVPGYDLRLVNLALGALGGWVGVLAFAYWRRRSADEGGPEPPPENAGWAAVRSRSRRA
jgi:hypothetical protein